MGIKLVLGMIANYFSITAIKWIFFHFISGINALKSYRRNKFLQIQVSLCADENSFDTIGPGRTKPVQD